MMTKHEKVKHNTERKRLSYFKTLSKVLGQSYLLLSLIQAHYWNEWKHQEMHVHMDCSESLKVSVFSYYVISAWVAIRKLEIRTLREITKYVFLIHTSVSMRDNDYFGVMSLTISELLTVAITLSSTIWQWNQFVWKGGHAWVPLHLLINRALE